MVEPDGDTLLLANLYSCPCQCQYIPILTIEAIESERKEGYYQSCVPYDGEAGTLFAF